VRVCAGDTVRLDVDFLSPEQNQSTTAGYAISPALSVPVNAVNNGPGNTVHLQLEFIPAFSDTGFFTISYTATDNGTPPLSASVAVILQVLPAPSVVPVITGDTVACVGQTVVLSTDDGYPFHEWSNGMTGDAVNVGPGTYTVWAGPASCGLISDSIVVHGIPLPVPVINGVPFLCGDQPAQLSTTEAYAQYLWSNGDTVAAIAADTGSYSVTVTDAFGCSGTSMPVTVSPAPAPTAFFSGLPSGPVAPGTTVVYLDGSTGNGAVITGWHWDAGNLGSGDSTTFTITFPSPGVYPITLTVTTADGCTGTYVLNQTVLPTEVVVPNVFSPNGDGVNDALVFEGIQYLPNTALHVFNRWGQVLFQSGNYKNNWRPSPDIPEGTYFFVLKLEDGRTFTGHVTILR
jgi:gliding motility-associated-like protein